MFFSVDKNWTKYSGQKRGSYWQVLQHGHERKWDWIILTANTVATVTLRTKFCSTSPDKLLSD